MSSLVTAAELAGLLGSGTARVLDVQFALGGPPSTALYAAGHVPGAPHLPLEWALAGRPGLGGRHPLPEVGELEDALRRCGLSDGVDVVVYDQQASLAAGRAWWVLRWAGALGSVRVLDGGLAAWRASGRPVSTQPAVVPRGTVDVRSGALPHLDSDAAQAWARVGALVDVRARERFLGEVEPIDPVAGHIPGALNLPMTELLREDGRVRSPGEIRSRVEALGIDLTRPVGTSCGSGVTAAQACLALAEAGIDAVPYIGSWSSWLAEGRPVATGGG